MVVFVLQYSSFSEISGSEKLFMKAFVSLTVSAPVFSTEQRQDEDSTDLQVHVDVSLPGTPLSSDISGRSSLSAGSVTVTTPTCIRFEEGTGEATVTTIPT